MPQLSLKQKEKYLFVFLVTFGIMMLIMLPSLVYNKGIFLYYGDFNSQQLPFYQYAHDAVRSGNVFWDWGTDLGANFIGSYSFYLLGSPFFWLTIPFPSSAVVYLIPWLLALKTGVAALTSYAYIKRFVRNRNAVAIGAILYALSGFQVYNVFFNHFHDVVAFFPLLLIALEERVQNNRRGVFALAVAMMAVINYFFFTGQITFLIIYFVCRCFSKDFNINLRKFFGLALEAVLGVMLACFMFLPAVLAIANNPRVDSFLTGYDIMVYPDKFRIFRIIQSFFMIPDPPARSNLFSSGTARWASIAGYLPMFSMAGVIAFLRGKGKHWASRVIWVCIICSLIPILNTAFYAFNSSYYARWFYMPILLMTMMTAYVIDNKKMSLKAGVPICAGAIIFFVFSALVPVTVEKGYVWGGLPAYKDLFWLTMVITIICFGFLCYIVYFSKRNSMFYKKAVGLTVLSAFLCTGCIMWYGIAQGPYQDEYIQQAIKGKENISLSTGDKFFRVDMSEGTDNFPMFWGYSSMRAFHSIVPGSIMSFYTELGITRDVASRIDVTRYPLRSLLSVKYYFNSINEKNITMPGFVLIGTQNSFNIYENEYYIPMGFTYDYYVSYNSFKETTSASADRLLLKALVLDDAQIQKHSDILKPLPDEEKNQVVGEVGYMQDCQNRKDTAAYSFSKDTHGFTAKINLPKENLVFFSVPYDKGFTATVNGKPAEIENVDNGMMAVRCPAGDNEIRINYQTEGLRTGIIISIAGLVLLIAYLVVCKKKGPKEERNEIVYDYEEADDIDDDFDIEEISKDTMTEAMPIEETNEHPEDDEKPKD